MMIKHVPFSKLDDAGQEWVTERAGIFEYQAGMFGPLALMEAERAYAYHLAGKVYTPKERREE